MGSTEDKRPCYIQNISQFGCNCYVSLLTLDLSKVFQVKFDSNQLSTIARVGSITTADTQNTAGGVTDTQELKHHLQ